MPPEELDKKQSDGKSNIKQWAEMINQADIFVLPKLKDGDVIIFSISPDVEIESREMDFFNSEMEKSLPEDVHVVTTTFPLIQVSVLKQSGS